MSQHFDVLVIGGGPGGYVAAIRAAQMGFKTALAEGHKLGGECLNYGCIPSKALISAGHTIDKIHEGPLMGIVTSGLKIELDKLIDWKGGVVKQLTGGVGQLLKANGVAHLLGTASFEGLEGAKKIVKIDGARDSYDNVPMKGEQSKVTADRVIIATGSTTAQIPFMPINGKTVLGSREALDVREIPKKIILLGGGVIGLELGTFYAKLGTKVVVVEATPTLLPGIDKQCVDVVVKKLKKMGVEIMVDTKATAFKDGKRPVLTVEAKDGTRSEIDADWVLCAVGRRPRTQGLTLEKINLKPSDKGFIQVNARLETSVPGVFAIGDVIGGPMLAHKASFEGLRCVEGFKDPHAHMDARALPWAVFVDPEIAGVGHTEESAKAAGWDPVVGKCPFAANGRALAAASSDGFVKMIADRKTDRILGCHMVGPEVSNMVAQVALAIEMGATIEDLTRTIHAHPTLPETIMEAAESVHGVAVHFFERKERRFHGAHP